MACGKDLPLPGVRTTQENQDYEETRIMARTRVIGRVAICLLVLVLLWVSGAWAAPTSAEQARTVVANWLILSPQPQGARLSQQVKDVQTFADASGPLYFVVYLEPAGLVIVPGDDLVEPIIGFTPETKSYDPSPDNPLGALVNRDVPGRVLGVRQLQQQARARGLEYAASAPQQTAQRKWTALAQGQSPREMQGQGLDFLNLPNIDDRWVEPLVQSKWSQNLVDDHTAGSPHCYDYLTHWANPADLTQQIYYPCGCTATAMAQVMRKHKHPTAGVSATDTFPISFNVGHTIVPPNAGIWYNRDEHLYGGDPGALGGPYDWDSMELDPLHNATTDAQRRLIGALTHDAGTAAHMAYDVVGSGAWLENAKTAFLNTFMYGNAKLGRNVDNPNDPFNGNTHPLNIPLAILYSMVNASLDAACPVMFHISLEVYVPVWSSQNNHTIVGDGYGQNWGTWYHHLNMGWAGSSDLWYNLPDINSNIGGLPGPFNTITRCLYNIFPTGQGEIISGRVTNNCGDPVPGITVSASGPGNPPIATTSARGVYAFRVLPNSTYTIHVNGTGYTDQTVTAGESVDDHFTCGNRWGVNFRATRPIPTDPEYVLYNLGGLDLKCSIGYAINNHSVVAGAMKAVNSYTEYQPCFWRETSLGQFTFNRLGTGTDYYGELHGINDNGLAVGWRHVYPNTGVTGDNAGIHRPCFAASPTANTVNDLPYPITTTPTGNMYFAEAFGVNNHGVIVGNVYTLKNGNMITGACSWADTASQPQILHDDLAGTVGSDQVRGDRINDAGVIVGKCGGLGSPERAFQFANGSVTWLGPSGQNSEARALNNLSPPTLVGLLGKFDVLLWGGDQAVIFNGSAVTPLAASGSYAAHGINRQGQIVGQGAQGAFIWDQQHGLRYLDSLVNDPDMHLNVAFDINDNGEIVGFGWYKCYGLLDFAFMLRPLFTITATAGPGGKISPTGAVKVVRGDTITFDIIPDTGASIADVQVDGVSQGAISRYTFPPVTANHTIHATFTGGAATHTIHASAGTGGSISPFGDVPVNDGATPTFTITANTGYRIADVKVDGASVGPITTNPFSYKFPPVTADHTIEATFTAITYTITASAGTGGSISPVGAVKVNYGDTPTFTITPDAGYQILDVKVDGASVGAVASYKFPPVTADRTIEATFTAVTTTYNIIATVIGTGGTISPYGTVKVNAGASQTFVFSPNTGYRVKEVKVDGTPQSPIPASYTFGDVHGNHTIEVSFELKTFTITASAGSGGSISPVGAVKVNYGDTPTFTITANTGYKVADVKVDGASVGAVTSYTFPPVTADHTIAASFATTSTYTLTASAGPGGKISPDGTVTVNAGASQTFTITANTGYKVADVKVDGTSVGAKTSYLFTNVQGNHTIEASFATTTTYTITVTQGANGNILPAGPVTVNSGDSKKFTIIAAPCFIIENVIVDGVSQGPIPSFTFPNITADHVITASFKRPGISDWILNPANGHLYKLVGPWDWSGCEALAQAEGAHLVTIRNAAEQFWLLSTFCRGEQYFIGFTDEGQEGNWRWVSGEPVTYTNWAPGQPDNYGGVEDYAVINYDGEGRWNDWPASAQFRGIIEKTVDWQVNPANGHLYKLVGPGTWQDCENLAMAMGAHLVTINNNAEQQWLVNTFGNSERYYIGYTDAGQEGTWRWVSGETADYTNWAPGEPNNYGGGENYSAMNWDSQGRWNDLSGSDSYRGIIEYSGDWITNPANGHLYKLVGPGNGQECETMARAVGAHLVTIRNAAEQQWLLDTFGSGEQYYIGFTDEAHEGTWAWRSGEPVTYTNWASGQPDNYGGAENWAVMNWGSQGSWNDSSAGVRVRGIIEKSGETPTPGKALPWVLLLLSD
jgi:hypothetical protein